MQSSGISTSAEQEAEYDYAWDDTELWRPEPYGSLMADPEFAEYA